MLGECSGKTRSTPSPKRDLAHGEARGDARAVVAGDADALVGLHARARALGDLVADPHRVAGGEVGDVLAERLDLLGLQLSDQVHRRRPSLPACCGGGVRVRELCFSIRVRSAPRSRGRPARGRDDVPCQPLRLGASPCGDPAVVPREENLGDPPAFPFGRARVLRELQQPAGEGFLHRRAGVPEDAAYKPNRRVDQGHRGDLAAGQHEIPEARLPRPTAPRALARRSPRTARRAA